jgi:hypothetical protein
MRMLQLHVTTTLQEGVFANPVRIPSRIGQASCLFGNADPSVWQPMPAYNAARPTTDSAALGRKCDATVLRPD